MGLENAMLKSCEALAFVALAAGESEVEGDGMTGGTVSFEVKVQVVEFEIPAKPFPARSLKALESILT